MDYEEKRKIMVDEQIVRRGITGQGVVDSFLKVPRERFVPSYLVEQAYEDHPLPVGSDQTISQPFMVATMTESLRLKGDEKVLEIGTGSGYQAAILSNICREVYTVERVPELLEQAKKILSEQGNKNIHFKLGDGTKGWEEEAPFDAIIVTASAPYVPEPLKLQLAVGGRLAIPVGNLYSQVLVVIERKGNQFMQKDICGCVFVPMIGEYGWDAND